MAPPASALAEQQDAAARLLALEPWTEVPLNPPASTAKPPVTQKAQKPAAQEVPKKPWEGPDASKPHPYHIVMSEGMFQKLDYVWKRGGNRSLKEWVLLTLEAQANAALKKMGE